MATLHASDVSGGSHHDALLGLRDLPFLKDKYTVEYIWLGASSPRARSDNDTSPGPRNVAQTAPSTHPRSYPTFSAALQEATTVT